MHSLEVPQKPQIMRSVFKAVLPSAASLINSSLWTLFQAGPASYPYASLTSLIRCVTSPLLLNDNACWTLNSALQLSQLESIGRIVYHTEEKLRHEIQFHWNRFCRILIRQKLVNLNLIFRSAFLSTFARHENSWTWLGDLLEYQILSNFSCYTQLVFWALYAFCDPHNQTFNPKEKKWQYQKHYFRIQKMQHTAFVVDFSNPKSLLKTSFGPFQFLSSRLLKNSNWPHAIAPSA